MQLAELQSVWNEVNADIAKTDFVDQRVVKETIHSQSQTEIGKICRSLRIKLMVGGLVLIIGVMLLVGMIIAPQQFNTLDFVFGTNETIAFYLTLILAIGVMLRFNHQAYQKILKTQRESLPLMESLSRIVVAMKKAIRFNIYSDAFMTPIIFSWLLYAYAYRTQNFEWDMRAAVLIIFPMVIGVFSYYVQRYSQQLKFGNYIDKLQSYIKDLEEK